MATKPSVTFTFATDANFASGPALGLPTKIAPSLPQGFVPGLEYAAEFRNYLFNVCGDWITNWLDAGSAAGAADAHIVETDASGHAGVLRLNITGTDIVGTLDDSSTLTVRRDKRTGTAANKGGNVELRAAQGQDSTGAGANSDGGNVRLQPGDAGTGGSGAAGERGDVVRDFVDVVTHHQRRFVDNTGGGTGPTIVDTREVAPGTSVVYDVEVVAVPVGGGAHQYWKGSAAVYNTAGTATIAVAGEAVSGSYPTSAASFALANPSGANYDLTVNHPADSFIKLSIRATTFDFN